MGEPKVVPADVGESEGEGGMATFRRLMEEDRPILKATLIEKLVETGISEASANCYVVWAKRTEAGSPDKNGNPFEFCIVESKDEHGNKIIKRTSIASHG